MSLPVAYCVQTDSVIDIVRAHDHYFSQDVPREDLTFHCPDELCRNRQTSPPVITGVNYNKIPKIDKFVQKPHFRLRDPERHRAGCPWVEVKEAIDAFDDESGPKRFSNLKRSDLIDVFSPPAEGEELTNLRIDAAQVKAISGLPSRQARIEAYKAYLRENPNRSSRLQEVAACFENMTEDERKRTMLIIEGVGEKTYRQQFTSAEYCNPNTRKRIYYGFASVSEEQDGFILRFRRTAQQSDGSSASVNVVVSRTLLHGFRGKGLILATLLAAQEIGGFSLSCYAFGEIERIDTEAEPRIFIQLDSLHSLSVMLRAQG